MRVNDQEDMLHTGGLVPTVPAAGRHDLADCEWACWSPCCRGEEGRAPAEVDEAAAHRRDPVADPDRRAVAGRPAGYGPWQSVYGLFRRWQRDGTWRKILTALQALADAAGQVTWDVSVDSGTARAHQHAAGARKDGGAQKEPPGGTGAPEPADHGLGRSRGGLTSKVHLACEQGQKPLSVIITAGQRGDSPQFTVVLDAIRVPRPGQRAGPAPARTGSWRTRPTAPAPTALTCAAAASAAPSRRKPTRSANRKKKGSSGAARPPSTPSGTSSATPWSAASTGSSATAPSPPATTSSPSATRPPSTSPPSANGSDPSLLKHALVLFTGGSQLPAAVCGTPYSQQLQATGGFGALRWAMQSGTLPAGLVLSPEGVISGVAVVDQTAPGPVVLTITDSAGQTTPSPQLTIHLIGRRDKWGVFNTTSPVTVDQDSSGNGDITHTYRYPPPEPGTIDTSSVFYYAEATRDGPVYAYLVDANSGAKVSGPTISPDAVTFTIHTVAANLSLIGGHHSGELKVWLGFTYFTK